MDHRHKAGDDKNREKIKTHSMTKMTPDFTLEDSLEAPVCGLDEAGRGPLAGPVIAACVHIPQAVRQETFLTAVNDSKKLSPKKRENLFHDIKKYCAFGIGKVSPDEIDALNIHHASLLAMRRAYETLLETFGIQPRAALIDGKFKPDIACSCLPVIGGDGLSVSIAAASILAKVTRDNIMATLHEEHPLYGWDRNAGYGTPEHLRVIADHGITPHHRRSFAPVKEQIRAV